MNHGPHWKTSPPHRWDPLRKSAQVQLGEEPVQPHSRKQRACLKTSTSEQHKCGPPRPPRRLCAPRPMPAAAQHTGFPCLSRTASPPWRRTAAQLRGVPPSRRIFWFWNLPEYRSRSDVMSILSEGREGSCTNALLKASGVSPATPTPAWI